MNSKANKSQIQFPPLLNLCNDRPHVDTTFKNWEKNNAPYLNDMISPVYIKESGSSGVYDYYGRKHQIKDGNWYIDGELKKSSGQKFTRTVLDKDMIAVAFDSNSNYWYFSNLVQGANNCSITLFNSNDISSRIFELTGQFVTMRFIIKDNDFYVVFLTKVGDTLVITHWRKSSSGNWVQSFSKNVTWYRQIASVSEGVKPNFEILKITSPDPIISIGFDSFGSAWISLVSNYGQALNSRYNGFATYYSNGNQIGAEIGFSDDDVTFNAPIKYQDTVRAEYTVTSDDNVFLSDKVNWANTYISKNYIGYKKFSVWVYVDDADEASSLGLTHGIGFYLCTGTSNQSRNYNDLSSYSRTSYWIDDNYFYSYSSWHSNFNSLNPVENQNVSATYMNDNKDFDLYTDYYVYVVNHEYTFSYVNTSVGNINFTNNIEDEGVPDITMDYTLKLNGYPIVLSTNGWSGGSTTSDDEFYGNVTVTPGVDQNGMTNTAQLIIGHDSDSDPFENDCASFEWYFGSSTVYGQDVTIKYSGTYNYTIGSSDCTAYPCIMLDNGKFYTMTGFVQPTVSALSTNTWLPMTAVGKYSNNKLSFDSFTEAIHTNDTYYEIRSNSVIVNQNLFAQTIKYTKYNVTPAELAAGTAENGVAYALEVYNSNCTDLKYMPGTSRYTGFNYYSDYILEGSTSGAEEDRLVYCTIGHRVKVNPIDGNAGFKLLFNTTTDNSCYIQGISWANSEDYIGTLLTPWQEVSEDFYLASYGNKVIYKNKYDEIVLIERGESAELVPLFDNKYILCNTDEYWNLYDAKRQKWFHYASDWNFRCLGGTTGENNMACYYNSVYSFMFKYLAASQNQVIARTSSRTLYSNPNIYPVASWQTPLYSKARILTGNESLYGAEEPSFGSAIPLGVDVYYTRTPNSSTSGIGDAYYQYTYSNGNKTFNTTLSGQTYVITTVTSSFLNPSLFATYLDGAGNNDLVYDLKEAYTVNYYNNNPTFIYLISSEVNGADAFFVIQGQFYAIMNDKICSVNYVDSVLSSKDPIIDINGMKFVGNNPMIAFFWSERYKAFYSFTGDANLEHIYNANKFSNLTGKYYYDKSTQTIYVPTSKGLLCFGPKNTYILEQFKNVDLVQFTSDNVTHIEDSGMDYSLVFYNQDGYEVNNVDLESSFFGLGATESTSIDRWNITLYDLDGTHPSGEVLVGVRSLTDITVKSEEKKVKITPDMWDKWSNSILITYNPKLIKAQGLRLYVNSPFIVQSITAHVMDNGTGTLSNKKGMV